MESTRLVWSRSLASVPWVAVFLVLFVAAFINAVVDIDSLRFDIDSLVPATVSAEPASDLPSASRHLFMRLTWGMTAMGFLLVAVAALAMSVYVFSSCLLSLPSKERAITASAVGVLIAIMLGVISMRGDWVLSEPSITTALRKATMHRTSATHAVSVNTAFDNLSALLFIFLISAATAVLASPRGSALTAESLSRRLGQLRLLLYFGAAALVLRALEMYSLYRWPSAWLAPDGAGVVDKIAIALSTAHGAFYTAVLMALYLPAAFILRFRAGWLARQMVRGTPEERGAWMTKMGLSVSPFQELAGLFATVAPLIAGGSVTRLIESLSG